MNDRLTYLGCDPGRTGAIVWIDRDGRFVDVADLPSRGDMLDPVRIVDIMRRYPVAFAALEKPGRYGEHRAALFSLGTSTGILYACMSACDIAGVLVPPAAWKARMLVTSDKTTSIAAAQRHLPGLHLRRSGRCTVDSHDRAEAGLLALYARAAHFARSPDSDPSSSDLTQCGR